MGLYIRGSRYNFKKQIEGKVYYRALRLRKGQESLLSARLAQVEEEIIAQHFGLPHTPSKQISFKEYIEKYIKAKTHKKSLIRDRQRFDKILEFWGNTPLQVIDKSHIQKLEKHLFAMKLKATTVNRYFEILRHLFNLAIEDGYVKENPARFYQPFVEDGERRALGREELVRILAAAKDIQDHPLSPTQGIIYDLVAFALEITRRQKSKGDYVFPINWRDPGTIYHIVRKIRKLSGVEDFTFHQLRHTASTVLSSRVSLATAKKVLGHADIKTTLKYTHPEISEQKDGVAKIGEFFSDLSGKV